MSPSEAMDSLRDAVRRFSGGTVHISDNRWQTVVDWLRQAGYTADEYVFYIGWFFNGRVEPARFTNYALMRSQKAQADFLEFKKNRKRDLQRRIAIQIAEFQAITAQQFPPMRLLSDPSAGIGPPLRLELAWQLEPVYPDIDVSLLLRTYRDEVAYLLRGSPEYLELLPEVAKHRAEFLPCPT